MTEPFRPGRWPKEYYLGKVVPRLKRHARKAAALGARKNVQDCGCDKNDMHPRDREYCRAWVYAYADRMSAQAAAIEAYYAEEAA